MNIQSYRYAYVNHRKLIGIGAAAAVVGIGMVGTATVGTASGSYTKIVYSGPNIADPGSLTAGTPVTICVQPQDSSGAAVGGTVFLSFATEFTTGGQPGGTAMVGTTTLTTTPQSFDASSLCISQAGTHFNNAITVTYTAPNPYPSPRLGRDVICSADTASASAPACTGSAITNTDVYVFSPVTSYSLSSGPPIAPTGSLAPHTPVTFAVTALDGTGHGVPGVTILLALTGTPCGAAGSATGTDDSTGTLTTKTIFPAFARFVADQNGAVTVVYTSGTATAANQVDKIVAEDHPAGLISKSTTYTYGAAASSFHPTSVGAPSLALPPDGSAQLVFWRGAGNHLFEGWFTCGGWHGPADLTAADFGGADLLSSAPSAIVTADGSTQLVFWQGAASHLFEAWYAAGAWHGPIDITSSYLHGASPLLSAPSVAVTPDGSQQLVYWQGTGNHLDEAWYAGGRWNGPVDLTATYLGGAGPLSSAPSATVTRDGSTQLVFWQGAAAHLFEAWYAAGGWHGPVDWTGTTFGGAQPLFSSPSVTTTPDGSSQLVYWQGAGGHLVEAWWAGGRWNGPVDLSAAYFGGAGSLTSPPTAGVTVDGSTQLVFWAGPGQTLREAWYTGRWNGPISF